MIQKADNKREKGLAVSSFRPVCLFRSAFTLLELLIVLTIIIMVMSIATPSVTQILDKAKFRDGVLGLQAELGRTRLMAMKSGVPMVFRYQNGSGRYQIFPKSTTEKEDFSQTTSSSAIMKTLPENALFLGGMTMDSDDFQPSVKNPRDASESRSEFIGSFHSSDELNPAPPLVGWTSFSSDESLVSGDGWSKPILFYPNGRTSTAVIFLRSLPERGKNDYYSEISFRGMTGAARVSSISTSPPGTPEFPSVLSNQALARWRQRERSDFSAETKGGAR